MHVLCASLGTSPKLKQVTVRELLRNTSVVRNSIVTYGGKPSGVVFVERKPRVVVTIENSSLKQLILPVALVDQVDQTLQKLALKS